MQSLRRAIKRCNAILAQDPLTKNIEEVRYKGTNKVYQRNHFGEYVGSVWDNAVANRSQLAETAYIEMVTQPIVKS